MQCRKDVEIYNHWWIQDFILRDTHKPKFNNWIESMDIFLIINYLFTVVTCIELVELGKIYPTDIDRWICRDVFWNKFFLCFPFRFRQNGFLRFSEAVRDQPYWRASKSLPCKCSKSLSTTRNANISRSHFLQALFPYARTIRVAVADDRRPLTLIHVSTIYDVLTRVSRTCQTSKNSSHGDVCVREIHSSICQSLPMIR